MCVAISTNIIRYLVQEVVFCSCSLPGWLWAPYNIRTGTYESPYPVEQVITHPLPIRIKPKWVMGSTRVLLIAQTWMGKVMGNTPIHQKPLPIWVTGNTWVDNPGAEVICPFRGGGHIQLQTT